MCVPTPPKIFRPVIRSTPVFYLALSLFTLLAIRPSLSITCKTLHPNIKDNEM